MIKIQYLTPTEHNGCYGQQREEFMKTLSLELFNFNVSHHDKLTTLQINIVYNQVFAVATMALKKVDANLHHITTRYYFSQLWCEFTKEVLTEFLEEDAMYKE